MSLLDKLRTQKVLSFTLILFTLSCGIVIGTLVNQGVKAAKNDGTVAPGATPLVTESRRTVEHVQHDCQTGGAIGSQHFDDLSAQGAVAHATKWAAAGRSAA
jgi:hypothetical protein